jgi:glycosyltransferase involved in cell wall biosynthesis
MQSLFDTSVPGVPHLIYTDHTNRSNLEYASGLERSLYPPRWQALEAAIYHNASRVFVRSHNVLQTLVTHYGLEPERVHCVYAGSNAKVALRPRSGERYDGKRILFVGLDWERKGGPTLLEAFRRIRPRHPDATLTLVGASPALDEPNVDRVGPVSLDRVNEYYEQASVFCMPTWQEPFGIVFVEAMSHGLPILSTRVGALPDMVEDGHNGYLIEPGDADSLAAHLDALLSDPERRRRLGENGRALARDRYNWDRVGQRMEHHIRQVLAGTPSDPGRDPFAQR